MKSSVKRKDLPVQFAEQRKILSHTINKYRREKKSVSQILKRNQFFPVHQSDYFMPDVDFADGKESIWYKYKTEIRDSRKRKTL